MLDIAEEGFQSELQYFSILIQSGSYVKHLSNNKNCVKNQELVLKDFDLVSSKWHFTRVFFDSQQIVSCGLSETNFFLNVSRREIKKFTLLLSTNGVRGVTSEPALTPHCFQVSGEFLVYCPQLLSRVCSCQDILPKNIWIRKSKIQFCLNMSKNYSNMFLASCF